MFLDQRDHELFEKERDAFGCFHGTLEQDIGQLGGSWHRPGDFKRFIDCCRVDTGAISSNVQRLRFCCHARPSALTFAA